MLSRCSSRSPWPLQTRSYAISVKPPKVLEGKRLPRVFKDKKAFQFNWYTKILQTTEHSPLVFLRHNAFSAQRLVKLRNDIAAATKSKPSLASPTPIEYQPQLTVIRSSIFGAALREYPGLDVTAMDKMTNDVSGGLAVLSLPVLDPPRLHAILRVLDRSFPPRKPKTEEELKKELEEKNADPVTPGRRMKKQRAILHPELTVVGAIIDGKVFLPEGVREVSKLPTLETLRAQIVGLLSAPSTQLAAVLSEASGGRLARTLEGLRQGLEETSGPEAGSPPS
ncbi:hypothetical protein EYR40_003511 [Pleurotus pulmonarius]|nr:hypothetical protein EYR36_007920 [Pleurotus pulmonarius]KAF4604733.1 hypothetical protein EYR40_003511 [Pleurotus pulmonarius]KAF4606233.1 hypothetical protein EYR38_000282 [Pleurotus pulmonarius]